MRSASVPASLGFLLLLLAAPWLHAQEWSIEEALQRCMLNNGIAGMKEFEPKVGDTKYGATFWVSKGSGTQGDDPRLSGWCVMVEEGQSEFRVRNGKNTTSTQRPWRLWYRVETYSHLNQFWYSRGLEWVRNDKTDTFLASFPKELGGEKLTPRKVGLGDDALIASARSYACLYIVQHPVRWIIRVSTFMQLGDLDYYDPQTMVRNNTPELTRSRSWPDVEKLGAKFVAAQARSEEVATRMGQQIVSAWNGWASRRIWCR
mgnify:CR=1 FL=1